MPVAELRYYSRGNKSREGGSETFAKHVEDSRRREKTASQGEGFILYVLKNNLKCLNGNSISPSNGGKRGAGKPGTSGPNPVWSEESSPRKRGWKRDMHSSYREWRKKTYR